MPTYSITAPNGKTYSIEGPDGASQQDVMTEVLRQNPEASVSASKVMIYSLKAPDGYIYEVEAPEGSTEQQLSAWLYALRPEAAVAKVTLREILPNEPEEADSTDRGQVPTEGSKSTLEQLVTQVKSSLGVFDGNETMDRSGAVASTTIAVVLSAVIIFNFYKKIIRPSYTNLQKEFGYVILICTADLTGFFGPIST